MSARRKTSPAARRLDLDDLVVRPEASILDALRRIDRNRVKVVFVAARERRLVGALADGDVRRAILRGIRVDAPGSVREAMRAEFRSVGPEVGRAEVLDLMRAWHVTQLPILDAKGRMTGLHLLQELLGTVARPNRALIMAGGRGERLRPLTDTIPKPMLQVAGRPILERLVLHLVGSGVTELFLSVNYLGDHIERHFGDGSAFGCRIRYLREKRPLGTGGPISLLPRGSDDPVLVLNGDLVTQARIGDILDFHAAGGFAATLCVRPYEIQVPFGVVETRGDRLVALREKPTHHMLTNVGIYVLSPAALRLVPRRREFPITELFETCLAKRLPVGAHVLAGDWIDVGRPDEYRRARGES